MINSKKEIDHALADRVLKIIVIMPFDRCDKFRYRVHEGFLVLGKLGVMSDAASILHADHITHNVVHILKRVEEGRLQVGWSNAISDTKFVELA